MKKLLALILALAMLAAAGAVSAETAGTPDLYDLYETADGGRVWAGTAVPIVDGVAVTSPVGLPEKLAGLEIWDGAQYRTVTEALSTADGKVLVLLHETDGEKPAIPAYDFVMPGADVPAGELMVRSGDWMRSRINRAVLDKAAITWNNREALLLTLSGDTAVGSPLVTLDGRLAGIVTAEYAEGVNRYVALTAGEITGSLREAVGMLEGLPEAGPAPEGYTVTVTGNEVTFDWSGMKLPEPGEGEKLYHIVADSESSYLTYTEVRESGSKVTMLLTPGRTYISGMVVSADIPADLPEQAAVTSLPEAEPMTDYGFKSLAFAIAELPEGAPAGTMPVPAEQISETLLRSGRACIYSVSSYAVDKEMEGFTLLIALTAPDGSNYRYESGWYYDPTLNEKDEWYTSMEESGLLEMLNRNGYPEGIYEMTMYIDGKLADSFSFELVR